MSTPTELERAWAVLEPPRHAEFAAFPLHPDVGGVFCQAVVDRDGLRHLLVPATTEQLATDPRPSALTVTVHSLIFNDVRARWVDVCCTDSELNPEFDELIYDVLESVDGTDRPASAALRTINRWRRLFGVRANRGLSAQARRGLFAELMLLRAALMHHPHTDPAVWTGPLRQPHDFEFPDRCIEVKAMGLASEDITIHGIEQLASHNDRPLDLVVMTVIEDPAGMPLSDLVDEVRHMTAHSQIFKKLLRDGGWTSTAGAPDSERLTVSDLLRVGVGNPVPRLIPNSLVIGALAEGLSDLTYKLSTQALGDHGEQVTFDQLIGDHK